ncbi:hypothetical protein [Desulfosporosinus hippei]|uniref:Outer membrane protein TolC n=1 Tax=Desulfosporosinus hippei DSM 8344 TaxID=1121419 RepID=A0A1G8HHK0_9FIRM|nr:hypothetical protein [Desulfosporosinus hippei]SDI06042.1 Outer membrane protein TolC [Desulfosporosinus hippei DSM 8344]
MKKLIGVSILSSMLIFGQPFMALAEDVGSKTISFEDIESIITEQNIAIRINENERLKTHAGYSDLKRTIKDLEDDLEHLNDQRDQTDEISQIVALSTEKRALLDALKQLERNQVDRPNVEAIADLQADMNDDAQILTGESLFIGYNQLKVASSVISKSIDSLQDQLTAMQLQQSLGMVSHNSMNAMKTQLVDLQTQLESTEFQMDSLERQLKIMLNDQESDLNIGSISVSEDFTIEDEEADLAKAIENSYTIRLQENQIVILQATLDRAKKDNGMSSNEYKAANYDLENANLKLKQLKDALKADYYNMIDNIAKIQSDLRLAEQTLGDKKIALSEAQMKMGLGMISKLELDQATTNYEVQENAVKTKQIDLFNAKCNYEWFLKGLPQA